jgi:hypothetical protein
MCCTSQSGRTSREVIGGDGGAGEWLAPLGASEAVPSGADASEAAPGRPPLYVITWTANLINAVATAAMNTLQQISMRICNQVIPIRRQETGHSYQPRVASWPLARLSEKPLAGMVLVFGFGGDAGEHRALVLEWLRSKVQNAPRLPRDERLPRRSAMRER